MSRGNILAVLLAVIVPVASLRADPAPNEARVTRIIRDVRVLSSGGETQPAALDERVTRRHRRAHRE